MQANKTLKNDLKVVRFPSDLVAQFISLTIGHLAMSMTFKVLWVVLLDRQYSWNTIVHNYDHEWQISAVCIWLLLHQARFDENYVQLWLRLDLLVLFITVLGLGWPLMESIWFSNIFLACTFAGLKSAVLSLFKRFKSVFFAPTEYRTRLWVLMFAFAMAMTVLLGSSTVDIFYYMGEPFCLTSEMAGYIGVTRCVASCSIPSRCVSVCFFEDLSCVCFLCTHSVDSLGNVC